MNLTQDVLSALLSSVNKLVQNIDKLSTDEVRLLHEMYASGTVDKMQQALDRSAVDEKQFWEEQKTEEQIKPAEKEPETVSEIVEAKEDKPKKRGRPSAKTKTEIKSEDIPVTDFEGNVLPPEKLGMGSEDKVHVEEPNIVPSKEAETESEKSVEKVNETDTKPLEFNESQLDCYVSKFKREETFKSNPGAKAELAAQRQKINAFAKEAAENHELLEKYFKEILDEEDKDMTFKTITPFYVDNLAHYLTLREEIARYDEDKIVGVMKEISGGVLNDISQLNRYNVEAILSVLKK